MLLKAEGSDDEEDFSAFKSPGGTDAFIHPEEKPMEDVDLEEPGNCQPSPRAREIPV